MNNVLFTLCLIASLGLVAGCMGPGVVAETKERIVPLGDFEIYSDDAERTLVIMRDGNGSGTTCKSPPPDSVMAVGAGVSLVVPTKVGSDSLGDSSKVDALALGGRDSTVLVVRELFFRICELTLNHRLSKEEAISLFESGLGTLEKMLPAGVTETSS